MTTVLSGQKAMFALPHLKTFRGPNAQLLKAVCLEHQFLACTTSTRASPAFCQGRRAIVGVNRTPPTKNCGLDLSRKPGEKEIVPVERPPLRVFLSYAHADDRHRLELAKQLRILERRGLVEAWTDRQIMAGAQWQDEIDEALEEAHVFVALVTTNFLASEYITGQELARAKARHAAGEMLILPVIVERCMWEDDLGHFQALPSQATPVRAFPNVEAGWADVGEGLRDVLTPYRERLFPTPPSHSGAPGADLAEPLDVTPYLRAVASEHRWVQLRGMGAFGAEQLELERK